jgi:transposase
MCILAHFDRSGCDAGHLRHEEKLRRAKTLIAQGLTVREAAARIKVSKTALYAALGEEAANASDLSA